MGERIPILYVNPFAQAISGNDEALLWMLKVLDKDRFEPHILLPARGPYAEKYEKLGAKLHFKNMSTIHRSFSPVYLAGYTVNFLPSAIYIYRLIKRIKAKIVHTNTTLILGSGIAAKLAGVKSVYHEHATSISHPEWAAMSLVKAVDRLSDAVLANTGAVAHVFTSRGVPESKVKVMYYALDLKPFETDYDYEESFRKEIGVGRDEKLIGLVGRINPGKGHDILFHAIKSIIPRHPSLKVAIVGKEETRIEKDFLRELKALAEKMDIKDRIIFTGMRDDVPRVMKSLDLLVLPSHHEGFGIVLMEAMAAGVPVIGSNVGGIPEVIEHNRSGLIIDPGSVEALSSAIDGLLSDPQKSLQMAKNGRKRVEDVFSLERLGSELNGLYSNLLTL